MFQHGTHEMAKAMQSQEEGHVLKLQEMERKYAEQEQDLQDALARAQDHAETAARVASEEHSTANQAMQ